MTISSNTAYRLEVANQKRKGTYNKGNYNSLVAAETANNSATLSNLLPLFLLGIPLSGSEIIFYDIISSKGFVFYRDFTFDFFSEVIVQNLIIINCIAFLVAWPFARYIKIFALIPYNYMRVFIFVLLCFILYYVGAQYFQGAYYLAVFLILLPLGYLLRNQDTLPFVFVFILQERLYYLSLTLMGHLSAAL
jgi:TctA family transporter